MTINPRFLPVPTEFEVLATRRTRGSLTVALWPRSRRIGWVWTALAALFRCLPGPQDRRLSLYPAGRKRADRAEPHGGARVGVRVGRANSTAACFSASIKLPSNRCSLNLPR